MKVVKELITKLQNSGYTCEVFEISDSTRGLGVTVSNGQIVESFTDLDSVEDFMYLINLHLKSAKFHNQVERAHWLLDLYFCAK